MKQYKRKSSPQRKPGSSSFPMINKDAAGIDIGSGEHWVAVPEDRDEEPVRCFGCFTAEFCLYLGAVGGRRCSTPCRMDRSVLGGIT